MVYVKAIGYIRVSTEEQELSPEVQRRAIEEFARSRGFDEVVWFEDIGVSGGVPIFERRGFAKAIEYARSNGINVIIVYSIDRLGRSFYDIFESLRRLELEYRIRVVSVREEFLQHQDPLIRVLILSVLSWVVWYERYLIRERTRRALQVRGVRHSKEVPEETSRLIVDLYTKLGYSVKRIARALGTSERQVRKVLYRHGALILPEDTCPRCFSKLVIDDQYQAYYCRNCGFLRPCVSTKG